MNTQTASLLFDSLASPIRLQIFQSLMTMGTEGMIAGDLSKTLNIAPNNLSFHLKTLSKAGLVFCETNGRFVRYYANLDLMTDLVSFLTKNCCQQDQGEHRCREFCR
ncbi:ArsR family transcriptional regulator [Gallibacterium salpingitidis]|uniref:ArsR family transcriptional regulator n=1 Tax=Gallibacterium salpingitidis TaxID=505341 RepID=A0AB36E2S9_9PAST|nr:metalloregulator ArsR/SmtB family transcription factor [Gallibacterium salpingitidis]OBX10516.1 ArsR family transcriptional regulator [Gallibacterium salpingitidis]